MEDCCQHFYFSNDIGFQQGFVWLVVGFLGCNKKIKLWKSVGEDFSVGKFLLSEVILSLLNSGTSQQSKGLEIFIRIMKYFHCSQSTEKKLIQVVGMIAKMLQLLQLQFLHRNIILNSDKSLKRSWRRIYWTLRKHMLIQFYSKDNTEKNSERWNLPLHFTDLKKIFHSCHNWTPLNSVM